MRILLHNVDIRASVCKLPDESLDLVIADPPYGVGAYEWDRPVRNWLPLVVPKLKKTGSVWVFGSMANFIGLNTSDLVYYQDLVWEKPNGSSPTREGSFRRVHEHVVQFRRADAQRQNIKVFSVNTESDQSYLMPKKTTIDTFNGKWGTNKRSGQSVGNRRARSVIECAADKNLIHPCQKPVDLLKGLIEATTEVDDVVLDAFSGSASTAIACAQLGRRCLSIENDHEFFSKAHDRIRQVFPDVVAGEFADYPAFFEGREYHDTGRSSNGGEARSSTEHSRIKDENSKRSTRTIRVRLLVRSK